MRDFLLPLLGFTWIAAAPPVDNPLWERLLEKWGIAFVGIFLLWRLAKWTEKREAAAHKETVKREEKAQAERDERDEADKAERLALLARGNELNEKLLEVQTAHIAAQAKHSERLENLTRETKLSIDNSEAASRMLLRSMRRPCVKPFEFPEDKKD